MANVRSFAFATAAAAPASAFIGSLVGSNLRRQLAARSREQSEVVKGRLLEFSCGPKERQLNCCKSLSPLIATTHTHLGLEACLVLACQRAFDCSLFAKEATLRPGELVAVVVVQPACVWNWRGATQVD